MMHVPPEGLNLDTGDFVTLRKKKPVLVQLPCTVFMGTDASWSVSDSSSLSLARYISKDDSGALFVLNLHLSFH